MVTCNQVLDRHVAASTTSNKPGPLWSPRSTERARVWGNVAHTGVSCWVSRVRLEVSSCVC